MPKDVRWLLTVLLALDPYIESCRFPDHPR
jgi:hypothetical protein